MYGYVYKTTNTVNGKIYIGQKKSDVFLKEDYLGSGVRLKSSIKHHGRENFRVDLIECCNSKSELDEREKFWINYFDSRNPKVGYNITIGGDGTTGCTIWNKGLTKELDSRLTQSPETCAKRSASLKKAYKEGRHSRGQSEEARLKISQAKKLHPVKTKGSSGLIWVTNTIVDKLINPEDISFYSEHGYVKGRTCLKNHIPWNKGKLGVQSSSKKDKICINNGIRNTYIPAELYEEYNKLGWVRGMHPRNIK